MHLYRQREEGGGKCRSGGAQLLRNAPFGGADAVGRVVEVGCYLRQGDVFVQNGVDAELDFFLGQLLLQSLAKGEESGAQVALERGIVVPLLARLGEECAEMLHLQEEIPRAVGVEGLMDVIDSMAVVLERLRLLLYEVVFLLQEGIARHEVMPFAAP